MASSLNTRMGEPVVVAQATTQEKRWGFWQFPSIGRHPEGSLVLKFSQGEDKVQVDVATGLYSSRDNGITWQPVTGWMAHWPGAIQLPNGDWVHMQRVARPYDQSKLTPPVGQSKHYNYWRENDVPAELRPLAWWRYSGSKPWQSEDCHIHLDGMTLVGPRADGKVVAAGFFPEGNICLTRSGRLLGCGYTTLVGSNGTVDPGYSAAVIESDDNGINWHPIHVLRWNDVEGLGPNECYLCEGTDSSLTWVMRTHFRTGTLGPMLVTRSTNGGQSWSTPAKIDEFGVLPQLLLLKNGVMVISYGRPGVHLKFSTDNGVTWRNHTVVVDGTVNGSCSYTGLTSLTDDSFAICYSHFSYPNPDGVPVKSILVRTVLAFA